MGVLESSELILCTIASTVRLMREWEDADKEHNGALGSFEVHTAIIDECGCTPESSVALLLRLQPSNLVLVGDHRQLPPCSMVPPRELEGTGHDRSLLERCVLGSGQVHRLLEQYRMPAQCCALVSQLFYHSLLTTPAAVGRAREQAMGGQRGPLTMLRQSIWQLPSAASSSTATSSTALSAREKGQLCERFEPLLSAVDELTDKHSPLLLLPLDAWESRPEGRQSSFINEGQATAAIEVAHALRLLHGNHSGRGGGPTVTIAILSFYKAQFTLLTKLVPAALRVEVLTVDSCQGSEFDFVVLSTVSAPRQCGLF
jgi:hypothetical protein